MIQQNVPSYQVSAKVDNKQASIQQNPTPVKATTKKPRILFSSKVETLLFDVQNTSILF